MAMILVVDELLSSPRICHILVTAGHQVVIAHDSTSALRCIQAQLPDVVVANWMLDGGDGVTFLQTILATHHPPILVLSTQAGVTARIRALESGADDYLVKPFADDELLARIQVLLRRRSFTAQSPILARYSDLVINVKLHEAYRGPRLLTLTPTEYALLVRFLDHPEQVLIRTALIRDVWGFLPRGTGNNLSVYVRELRKKLEANGEPRLIHTVRGAGYVLRDSVPHPTDTAPSIEESHEVG